jgi:uncharacterized RDD family membrane protein YckC
MSAALAGRGRRLVATIIDALIVPMTAFALMMITGAYEHAEDYVGNRPIVSAILLAVGGYVVPNGWLLYRRGQTIGKLIFGVMMVEKSTDAVPPLWRLFARGLVFLALSVIDVVFIFRRDRACLHDLICSTRVVARADVREAS